ncbi:MAG: tRNA (guanosine(46)-N7)-methyltransferase TrmB [Akkermansia sp.]
MTVAFIPDDFFRQHAPKDIFGVDEPFEVDLGCGEGGFLLQMARHYPEKNFLGIERLMGRVRGVCTKAEREGLDNVRVLRIESSYFLDWFLKPRSIARLHYLCPDPWPKVRHYKNRLIQDSLMPILHKALADEGEILFKSDHEEYYEWVVDHFKRSGLFKELPWGDDDFFYPKTDFQLQWEAQGKSIFRSRFLKK